MVAPYSNAHDVVVSFSGLTCASSIAPVAERPEPCSLSTAGASAVVVNVSSSPSASSPSAFVAWMQKLYSVLGIRPLTAVATLTALPVTSPPAGVSSPQPPGPYVKYQPALAFLPGLSTPLSTALVAVTSVASVVTGSSSGVAASAAPLSGPAQRSAAARTRPVSVSLGIGILTSSC